MTSCCLPLEPSLPHELVIVDPLGAVPREEPASGYSTRIGHVQKPRLFHFILLSSPFSFFLLLCFSLLYFTSFFSSFPSRSHVFLFLFIFFLHFLVCLVFHLSIALRSLASKMAWHSYCYWNQETAGRKWNINVSISAAFIDYLCIRITCGIRGPPHGRTLFATSWVEGKWKNGIWPFSCRKRGIEL